MNGRLILLAQGRVVYSGPLDQALSWFESKGVKPCPVDMNPLDYIMDHSVQSRHIILQDASRMPVSHALRINTEKDKAIESKNYPESPGSTVSFSSAALTRIDTLPMEKPLSNLQDQPSSIFASHGERVGLWTQVATLAQRHWINTRRGAMYFWGVMAVYIVFGIMVGVVFWKLDGGIVGIRGRPSVIYVIGAFQPYLLSILSVYKGVVDMKVYDRERKDGLYSPAAFIISYSLCQIPVNIVSSIGKY